ncbi:MAG: bifunctional phosphopantothenoylcysteine decarboxylase/phosphopantothenate--cysteine ligase CoaBC [Deltaproteobacteria bacterium]
MMKNPIKNKKVILAVCGGIAAYKSVEILRLLKKADAEVRVILTRNAQRFVGSMTFEALSGQPVFKDMFAEDSEASFRHIDWAREADGVIIAPATANMIGKLANGIADDPLSTFMLAVTSPVLICPSMNIHMYASKVVQRNLDTLRSDGYFVLKPGSGQLACGTYGPGRLPEPEEIFDRFLACLSPKDLAGKKILVTAGPTIEPIDPVRFISNPSSGKMGFAVARAAEHRGAEVTLISGPTHLSDPMNMTTIRVRTAEEMAQQVFQLMENAEVIIKSAAVSDYRPKESKTHKIKKGKGEMVLRLQKNATEKLAEKNLDIIAANLVGSADSGFASDTNTVTLFFKDGTTESLPAMDKMEVAHILLDRLVARELSAAAASKRTKKE